MPGKTQIRAAPPPVPRPVRASRNTASQRKHPVCASRISAKRDEPDSFEIMEPTKPTTPQPPPEAETPPIGSLFRSLSTDATGAEIRVVPRDGGPSADTREGRRERGDGRDGGNRKDKHRDENIVVAVGKEMMENDALNVAGGMAYFAFLALPPTIVVLFALTGFFGGDAAAEWITAQLSTAMPDEASDLIDGFVQSVVYTQAPGLFSVGLVLALWASSNIFMAVTRALNIAYDIGESRSFIKMRALALGVTVLFVVFLLGGSAVLLLGPQIANALDLFGVAGVAWSIAQWVLPFLLVVGAFAIAYYILPNRQQTRHNREILIGAVVGAVVWVLATVAFRFYIGNFGAYDETYGTLGGIIILLLWLYMTMLVILLGGQVAAELERRART
jgi:membrane protein